MFRVMLRFSMPPFVSDKSATEVASASSLPHFSTTTPTSFECFLFTNSRTQKLYRRKSTAVTTAQDPVTTTVTFAVMEYRPPCCEYTLISVDIKPAIELKATTLLEDGQY